MNAQDSKAYFARRRREDALWAFYKANEPLSRFGIHQGSGMHNYAINDAVQQLEASGDIVSIGMRKRHRNKGRPGEAFVLTWKHLAELYDDGETPQDGDPR